MDLKVLCAAVTLTFLTVWSGAVHATDDSAKGAARELANEAKGDFDAGRFEEAGLKFQRSYEIARVPTLAVWTARALARRGKWVTASELYREATLLAPNDLWVGDAQQKAQADAKKERGELQPRIPMLRIRVEGGRPGDIELSLDGESIPPALIGIEFPADPGERHIVGKAGAEEVEQTIRLDERERKDVVLRFVANTQASARAEDAVLHPSSAIERNESSVVSAPSPLEKMPSAPSSNSARRSWGWATLGVGAAGLLAGGALGIVVATDSGLRKDCPNGTCDPTKVDGSRASHYNLMRNLSTVGFIVGGIGTAVGVTLLLWHPKGDSESRLALWLGPSSAGVQGAF